MNTVHDLLLKNGFKLFKDASIGLTKRSQYQHSNGFCYNIEKNRLSIEQFLARHPNFLSIFLINSNN